MSFKHTFHTYYNDCYGTKQLKSFGTPLYSVKVTFAYACPDSLMLTDCWPTVQPSTNPGDQIIPLLVIL